MNFNISKKSGFSLIQLLVVIAIIGVLSSVVLANMSQAKMKARDAQRISDMENIQLALRLYKDANGAYPEFDSGVVIGEGGGLDALLLPYLSKVPADPLTASGTTYKYWYDSDQECIPFASNTILFVQTAELSANQGKWKGKGTSCFSGGNVTASSYGIILK